MRVSAAAGHRIWAFSYDSTLNPLLALEARVLRPWVQQLPAGSFLDVATGTGRWMTYLRGLGRDVLGVDLCPEMIAAANRKPLCTGRLAVADVCRLPFPDRSFDSALCSFAMSYIHNVGDAIRELARVSSRVIVSDLHPDAAAAGWKRSFRADGVVYELEQHTYSVRELQRAASAAGLVPEWSADAYFGPPEREIFAVAGKAAHFQAAVDVPAALICAWARP